MKYPVYAIRDLKSNFLPPQVEQNEDTAKRNFAFMVSNGNSNVYSFAPGDFQLFKVGEFNSATGTLVPVNPIEFIVDGSSVVGDKYEK